MDILYPSSSSFHTPLGITGCWSERLRETPSSLEILRFIPWTEQHQDVANAANASILRLSDDCAKHICHGESKKTFPQSGYDRQNFKKERQQKALWGPTVPNITSTVKSWNFPIFSNFHGIFFSGNSKFVTRIALISIGSVMSLRCKFQQRAFNLSRRNREETSGQIMVLGCFQK